MAEYLRGEYLRNHMFISFLLFIFVHWLQYTCNRLHTLSLVVVLHKERSSLKRSASVKNLAASEAQREHFIMCVASIFQGAIYNCSFRKWMGHLLNLLGVV